MELDGYGFEKSELKKLAENVHELKGEKQRLELELSSEEFHKKYIPVREKTTGTRILTNLPIASFFVVEVFLFIIVFILMVLEKEDKTGYAFAMLAVGVTLVYTACIGYKTLKEEIRMLVLCFYSTNPDKAMRFAAKHGINTFQDDNIKSDERIANLKAQIEVIDGRIKEAEDRQQAIIDESKKRDEVLKKYDIIRDDIGETKESKSTFSLKKDDLEDITELFEYYDAEESYTRYIINDLEVKLESSDKTIVEIEEGFERAKKIIKIILIVYFIAVILQILSSGIFSDILGLFCLILGLIVFFAFERELRGPVLRYLIEQESPLVEHYCFVNDIVPVKHKRQEIAVRLKQQQQILNDIKMKKRSLD